MNTIKFNPIQNTQKINFGDIESHNSYEDYLQSSEYDSYSSSRNKSTADIAQCLKILGVGAKIRDDKYLELSKLNKLKNGTYVEYNGIPICADYIFQYTKQINGSVDFGAINTGNLGSVEVLQGSLLSGNMFDFSRSQIENFGNLKTINGNMIINSSQLHNFDFSGLDIKGKIIVANSNAQGKAGYRVLSKFDKMGLLGGFDIINY